MSTHQDTLRKQAMELAIAQSAGIHDGYTRADAAKELQEADSFSDVKTFTPVEYLDGLGLEAFYNHVDVEAEAIFLELEKACALGGSRPHDDLTFAKLQGFYERLLEGDSAGRTHDDPDWNEAYDQGMNEAEAFLTANPSVARLRDEGYAVSVRSPEELEGTDLSRDEFEEEIGRATNTLLTHHRED